MYSDGRHNRATALTFVGLIFLLIISFFVVVGFIVFVNYEDHDTYFQSAPELLLSTEGTARRTAYHSIPHWTPDDHLGWSILLALREYHLLSDFGIC